MRITLLSDERLRFDARPGPLSVEAESAEMTYSPYHMLASGLAVCVASTVSSWASHANVPTEGMAIEVGWTFAEKPHRVGRFDLLVEWPELPEERRAAALRVVSLCPVHKTFESQPEVHSEIRIGTPV